jgi:hypothetical protein
MNRYLLTCFHRYVLLLICTVQIGGCAIVDQYGPRAISYNSEAVEFKSSVILLNIMRAAYREPLQFTDMSTVVGSASVNTSMQGQVPLRIGGPPPATSQFLNLTPNIQFSGGPSFTTNNLNTQEFYQGIQTSIATQTVANYLRAGGDPNVILPLVVSEIELNNQTTKTTFYNKGDVLSHNNFINALSTLIELGLTVEEEQKEDEVLSPKLDWASASDPRLLSGIVQGNASADSKSFKVKPATKKVAMNGKSKDVFLGYYQVVKPGGKSAKFCFRERKMDPRRSPGYSTYSSKSIGERLLKTEALSEIFGGAADKIRYDPNSCAAPAKADGANQAGSRKEIATGVALRIRSVQEIIYFLGTVARHQLFDAANPNYFNPNGPAYLFKVEERAPRGDEIHALLHGRFYTIATDPSGQDASTQAIQFLTEAWALQLSSKSLPTSNIITVVPQ